MTGTSPYRTFRLLNSSESRYTRKPVDQTCATSIRRTAGIHAQSGVSEFRTPAVEPIQSAANDSAALPRNTDKSTFLENSHAGPPAESAGRVCSCLPVSSAADIRQLPSTNITIVRWAL